MKEFLSNAGFYSCIYEHNLDSVSWYKTGYKATPNGFVQIYCERGYLRLTFIWKGVLTKREFNEETMTNRMISIRATKMVAEITKPKK